MKTGQDKVNIVGHSKGGLDARVFLAHNITRDDVANLIMIGTPNAGSPLADLVVHSFSPSLLNLVILLLNIGYAHRLLMISRQQHQLSMQTKIRKKPIITLSLVIGHHFSHAPRIPN